MQKDLLAELQLPKLDLKNLENIVIQNSKRLACVVKENNEFIKKSKTIPPGFKVVMGGRILDIDVKFPLSTLENIKTVKRKFIIKKALHPGISLLKNDLGTSPSSAVTNSSSCATPNSVQDSITNDKDDEKKKVEIPSLLSTKCHSNSTISPSAASLETCQAATTETGSSMGAVASSHGNEDAEVEILVDVGSNKCSDPHPVSLNSQSSLLKTNIEIKEPVVKASAEDAVVSSTSDDTEKCGTTSGVEDGSGPMCIITEVIGNAHAAFSDADDPQEKVDEAHETQLITPKKTNDITKIKGWRRKQFFVEKPTTVEFYSVSKGSRILKKKIELSDVFGDKEVNEEPGNKENAFVCDSLDEFLDQEADLKIGYEVPHLFAEYGIKLTSDEIVSRPSLSEKDLQEVGTRYCVPLSLPCDINLDDIKEEDIKRVKRPIEDDTKPCKALKVDDCRRQSVRSVLKQGEKLKTESPVSSPAPEILQKNECQSSRVHKDFNNIKLLSKLIALVVYPGPNRPLHPLVQYHLDKLRSYRTIVDKNWASFAASAVVVSDSRCKRRVVPAYCCVKVEKNLTKTNGQSMKIEQKKDSKKQLSKIKLKECSVVIKRLKSSEITDPWCMVHSSYNCSRCGLAGFKIKTAQSRLRMRSVLKVQRNIQKEEEGRKELEEGHGETITFSPRASFNRKIARLLAKKVRLLKANGDTLMSIDSLRVIKPDTIEFIKLKFIKESFLSGYINIWYLKPETSAVRSRAFLTFSQSSPVPNAINLKSTCLSLNNLPKVITEMVSAENTFDSNEYAILHCTDGIWEIHGSLNITFGNSEKYVEQIFTCLELPELKRLQEIAEKILRVKAVKWWVLDLTQKFKLIELKSGSFSTVVTRQKFLEVIKLNSFGFMPLRRDHENRILGAYVIQRLLPFVLIGPYYLLEARDIILKGVSSTVSFKYYGEDNVTTNYPLKFFINSVIKNLENKKNKKLEGLWLYDKTCLDKTIYIEVLTADLENHLPNKCSIIDIEHGYSLNSLTHSSPPGATSGIVKRRDGKDELQTVTVYLYFDIFDLGFLEGELQFDNSVIINHPLDERTKMKSHKIGDWILSIIRRKVGFIPKDLPVRWFITKHKEDLRERPPFNKLILGGAHVITKGGVFSLLDLTESKIESLGLDKNEILNIMSQCEVLREVKQLKNLAKLLKSDSTKRISMEEILKKAINEIKTLEELQMDLESKKALVETKKLNLASDFLKLVNSFNVRGHYKIKMIEIIEKLFRKENGKLNECFVKRLRRTGIGWNYLKHLEKQRNNVSAGSSKSVEVEHLIRSLQKLSEGNSKPRKPTAKASDTVETTNNDPTESQSQVTKLRPPSQEISPFKVSQAEILRTPSPLKEPQVLNVEGKEKKNAEIVVIPKSESDSTAKADGFIKLNSTQLPDNIKLCWKNWNVNKLEVA